MYSNFMRIFRAVTGVLVTSVAFAGTANAVTPSADLLACQKAIETQVRAVQSSFVAKLTSCTRKAVDCKLADEIDAVPAGTCLASVSTSCGTLASKIAALEAVKESKVVTKCGLIPLADINEFIAGLGFLNVANDCGAANINDLVSCIFDEARCTTERTVFIADPRAQDSLTALGIAASFPCVAP